MSNSTQTPEQEATERITEGLPGIKLAGAAVGLANHQQMLADHLQRVRDSHKMQARAMGMEDLATDQEPEEMGDIIICGDGCFNSKPDPVPITSPPPPAPAPPPPATTAAVEQPPSLASQAAKLAALMAGMGGAVGAGAYLGSEMAQEPVAVVQPAEQPVIEQPQPVPAAEPLDLGIEVEKANQ